MTSQLRAGSSIFRLAWANRRSVALCWDLWSAVAVGVVVLMFAKPTASVLFDVAAVEVGVASALVGVILAGLAVITAFMDRDYVAVLASSGKGVIPDVFHFRYTASIAVLGIMVNVAIIVVRDDKWMTAHLSPALAMSIALFSYTLFATLNLVSSVGGHMYNRALQLEMERKRDSVAAERANARHN